jgi:hypothetical protein
LCAAVTFSPPFSPSTWLLESVILDDSVSWLVNDGAAMDVPEMWMDESVY